MRGLPFILQNEQTDTISPQGKSRPYAKLLYLSSAAAYAVMLLAQIVLIVRFHGEQLSDASAYQMYAAQCADNNWWYPAEEHIHSLYIYGNGLVNLAAAVFRITRNMKVIYFINALFVQGILWSGVYILYQIKKRRTLCAWFIILFCLLNTMWSEVVLLRTEVPFTALCFLGLAMLFSKRHPERFRVLCGIILGIANWFRPLGIVFLAGAALTAWQQTVRESGAAAASKSGWPKGIRHVLEIAAGYLAAVLVIGCLSLFNCGYFVYQATTLGVNLLTTANDYADGSYTTEVFQEGNPGYISPEEAEHMTFRDYDEYFTSAALDWIKRHPFGYLRQIPWKLFLLYSTEIYSGSAYFNNTIDTSGMEYVRSVWNRMRGAAGEPLRLGDLLICFDQLWYMLIFGLFVCGVIAMFLHKQFYVMLPLLLAMGMGTGITVIVVCGGRYHFPYLPIMMMFASLALDGFMTRKQGQEKPRLTGRGGTPGDES